MNKRNITIVVTIILIGLLIIMALNVTDTNPEDDTTTTTSTPVIVTTTPGNQNGDDVASPTPQQQVDWQTYDSTQLGFSIDHPEDIEVQLVERQGVQLQKWGPTQEENTEFYDGISLTFRSGDLVDQSVQEYAQAQAQEMRDSPVVDNVSQVRQINVGQYNGYSFEVESLGERTHIYLPKGEDQYLEIIDGTQDPTNAGFRQTVNEMFSTLEITE